MADDNSKALEAINHGGEIHEIKVQSGNFNRRSRDQFFAPSSARLAIAARKNFDLPYMLLNSDESNFPRLPEADVRDSLRSIRTCS